MKNVKEILEQKKYILKLEKELEEQKDSLVKMIDNIDLEEVKALSYDELLNLNKCFSYKNEDISKKVSLILKEKLIAKYPQFSRPHYFPELNELQHKYPNELLMKIDKALCSISFNEPIIYENWNNLSRVFEKLKIDIDDLKDIIEFLHSKNIVSYSYKLIDQKSGCKCFLDEKTYLKYKENLDLPMNKRDEDFCTLELYRDEDGEDEEDSNWDYDENYKDIVNLEEFEALKKFLRVKRCKKALTEKEILELNCN